MVKEKQKVSAVGICCCHLQHLENAGIFYQQ